MTMRQYRELNRQVGVIEQNTQRVEQQPTTEPKKKRGRPKGSYTKGRAGREYKEQQQLNQQ